MINPLVPPVKYSNDIGLFKTSLGSSSNKLPFHARKPMNVPLESKLRIDFVSSFDSFFTNQARAKRMPTIIPIPRMTHFVRIASEPICIKCILNLHSKLVQLLYSYCVGKTCEVRSYGRFFNWMTLVYDTIKNEASLKGGLIFLNLLVV